MNPRLRRFYSLPLSALVLTEDRIVTVMLMANPADADSFQTVSVTFCPN